MKALPEPANRLMFPFGPVCNRQDVFATDASAIRRNLEICRYLIMSRSEKDVFRWTQSYATFGAQRETMAAMAATVLLEHQGDTGPPPTRNIPTHAWGPGMAAAGNPMVWSQDNGTVPLATARVMPNQRGGPSYGQRMPGGYMAPDHHVGGGGGRGRGRHSKVGAKMKGGKNGKGKSRVQRAPHGLARQLSQ